MNQVALMDLVDRHFGWLAREPGCELMADYDQAAFGNAVIVFHLQTFAVRVIIDRGQVWVDIGPRDAVGSSDLWTEMEMAIAFLRRNEVLGGNGCQTVVRINHNTSLESQIQQCACVLTAYYSSLAPMFGNEGFAGIRDSVELFRRRCVSGH